MALKHSSILLMVFLVSISCGKTVRNNSLVFLSKQLTSGVPSAYKTKGVLISTLKRHQLILDTDGDGILDKDDFDIDNDGIPNDCDLAPFDKTIGSADTDNDSIPDFCDLNPLSHKIPDNIKAAFQTRIFKQYGLLLIEDNLKIAENEIPFLDDLILKISEKAKMPNSRLLTLALTNSMIFGEYGNYDSQWANIRYTKDNERSINIPDLRMWQWALTHEFFHFVALANPEYYEYFHEVYKYNQEKLLLIYPTEYSKQSEEEYFAEYETSVLYQVPSSQNVENL